MAEAFFVSLLPFDFATCRSAFVADFSRCLFAWVGEFIKDASAPLIGHFAETDPFTSDGDVRALEEAYRRAGREIVTYQYPGTGHWFAEPSRPEFRADAADLAFDRTVTFLRDRLGAG